MSDSGNSEDRLADNGDPTIERAAPQKPGDALVGKTLFDRFDVLEVLGESAMALVLKAREVGTDRLVAIKTVTPHDPEIVKRFAQEVELHRSLSHLNIVEAIDCLETASGRTFFIMEFLYGASLQKVLQIQKRINNEEDLASILNQICDALAHAHDCGILHRDLKPANIFLLEKAGRLEVKVLDFGIAKPLGQQTGLTQAGYAVGSPMYMSPEQCRGQKVDFRSDVYSLGVLAYEMATGELPYGGQNIMTIMAAHCDPERKPTSLATKIPELRRVDELNGIIQKAMETDVANRIQTVEAFRRSVQRWYDNVKGDQLATLVSGEQLNLPPETSGVVAEEAIKSSRSNFPTVGNEEDSGNGQNNPTGAPINGGELPQKSDRLVDFAPQTVSPTMYGDPDDYEGKPGIAASEARSLEIPSSNSRASLAQTPAPKRQELASERPCSNIRFTPEKDNKKNLILIGVSITVFFLFVIFLIMKIMAK